MPRRDPARPDRPDVPSALGPGTTRPIEIPTPPEVMARHQAACAAHGTAYRLHRCYRYGPCSVTLTREFGLYHLSIAHPSRTPTWEEISGAWYTIVPGAGDRYAALALPPLREYVNLHSFCMQVIEHEPPCEHDPAPEEGGHAMEQPGARLVTRKVPVVGPPRPKLPTFEGEVIAFAEPETPAVRAQVFRCECGGMPVLAYQVEGQGHLHLQCTACGVSYCPGGACAKEEP